MQTFSDNGKTYNVDKLMSLVKDKMLRPKVYNIGVLLSINKNTTWGDGFIDTIERIKNCDTDFPIFLRDDMYIIDGCHRVAKKFINKDRYIRGIVIPDSLLLECRVEKK